MLIYTFIADRLIDGIISFYIIISIITLLSDCMFKTRLIFIFFYSRVIIMINRSNIRFIVIF